MKIIAVLLPLLALLPGVAVDAPADVAVRGPYHFILPVPNLLPSDADAVTRDLSAEFGKREVFGIKVQDGFLEFYTGGRGPKDLLRASRVERSLAKSGFSLHRRSWVLRPQTLGLVLGAKGTVGGPALEKAIAQIDGAAVVGTLLDRGQMVLAVEFEQKAGWTVLSKRLAKVGARIEDILWGHWQYGWQIEVKHHRHACGVMVEGSKFEDPHRGHGKK